MIKIKLLNLAILFQVFHLCFHREIQLNVMLVENHQIILSLMVIPKVQYVMNIKGIMKYACILKDSDELIIILMH